MSVFEFVFGRDRDPSEVLVALVLVVFLLSASLWSVERRSRGPAAAPPPAALAQRADKPLAQATAPAASRPSRPDLPSDPYWGKEREISAAAQRWMAAEREAQRAGHVLPSDP